MFLVSAFAKAWDAEAFADMLLLYGQPWFGIGAPVIIAVEAVLGMTLLLRVAPRWSAIAADTFLIVVSSIFAYGLLAKGITDCGCFGALSKLYTGKPWMTFARNALFGLISVPAVMDYSRTDKGLWPKICATLIVTAVAGFICGLAMRKSYQLPNWSSVKTTSREKTMEKLMELYPFEADSTYFVYLFSFSCAHCQNSYANVEQFQRLQLVDKVLGISIEDEEAKERFYRVYCPEIEIMTIDNDVMANITGSLPVGLYIRGDSIQHIEVASITSPGIFVK